MKTLIVTDLITNKLYDIICALCIWQMTILDASVEAIYKKKEVVVEMSNIYTAVYKNCPPFQINTQNKQGLHITRKIATC